MRIISPTVRILIALLAIACVSRLALQFARGAAPDACRHVYFGTYSRAGSEGVYHAEFDSATGVLSPASLVAKVGDPSFITLDAAGRTLYAVLQEGSLAGGVLAFAVDQASGKLSQLGERAACGGGPCYAAVDRQGKCLLVANYNTGVVAALRIHADGSLGDATQLVRQAAPQGAAASAPHAHSINASPDDRFAVSADLGLDELLVYRLDAEQARLTAAEPPFVATPAGSGPRHSVFHPAGRFLYSNMETSSRLVAYAWNPEQGRLTELESLSTLPPHFSGANATAEVAAHPNGRFIYVSNRGHDSIALFDCDASSGRLTARGHEPSGGAAPRHFRIDPTGRWMLVANQDSNNVVVLAIDEQSGKLSPTGRSITLGAPVCVQFGPGAAADGAAR